MKHRAFCLLMVVCMLFALGAQALAEAEATPQPESTPAPLKKGDEGEDVKLVQSQLVLLGYLTETPDGIMGSRTELAIEQYQQFLLTLVEMEVEGLPEIEEADGRLTYEQRLYMLSEDARTYVETLEQGDESDQVTRLQTRLDALGYLSKSVDGIYGSDTVRAVEDFQRINQLEETGVADEGTQALLFTEDALPTDNPAYTYQLQVSNADQKVYVYQWADGGYTRLIKTMVCSTGLPATPTPKGVFRSEGPVARWCYFPQFDCWAQYAFRIDGSILFHSVLYSSANEKSLRQSSVNNLGRRASHGCVRLSVEDAKWIYENCVTGTGVIVY